MASSTLSAPLPPAIDFSERLDPALLAERMDEPCTFEQLRGCLRDIAAVTRLTRGYSPTLRFLDRALPHPGTTPVRIVDVGSGGGDMLQRIARWAARRRLPVQLTGIDLNPLATRVAQALTAGDPVSAATEWVTGDVFVHPSAQAPDLVISSLVTHHMRDPEIVQFLRWMEEHARRGWFISDLVRSPRAYRVFRLGARLLRWHPFVQNDGLVSIRRGFREPDWERLLTAAGIPLSAVRLHRCAIGRLCLSRVRAR
jgi:2-polyprenyl-3-methyl-5-hydroxy-6-metoxy-1,4-benzoquinol methylase